jgi:ferric-dicitrate binding protein FerR (iron transport regulator)
MSPSFGDNGPAIEPGGNGSDALERLLRRSGRRPPVPAERALRVRANARAEWEGFVRRHRARRRTWRIGMVTTAAGVAALFWLVAPRGDFGRSAPPVELTAHEPRTASVPVRAGRVERVVEGAWSRTSAAGQLTASRSGDELLVGAELTTEVGGRLAMRLESGHSVRLDTASAIRVTGRGELALIRGAVYVDSGAPGRSARAIAIQTPHGAIRDEGTQFEVRDAGTSLRIRVREGKVALESPGVAVEVSAGQEVALRGNGGLVRRKLTPDDLALEWVSLVPVPFDVQGRSLQEFLTWAARERGLHLRFVQPDLAAAAPGIVLSGSIDGLTLDEALESVLLTCRMSHRIEERALVISRAAAVRSRS